jgi:hypothetical protein
MNNIYRASRSDVLLSYIRCQDRFQYYAGFDISPARERKRGEKIVKFMLKLVTMIVHKERAKGKNIHIWRSKNRKHITTDVVEKVSEDIKPSPSFQFNPPTLRSFSPWYSMVSLLKSFRHVASRSIFLNCQLKAPIIESVVVVVVNTQNMFLTDVHIGNFLLTKSFALNERISRHLDCSIE